MTTTGNPNSNLDSSEVPHDNTSDRQSAPTLDTSDVQKQTITSPKDTYKSDSTKHIHTNCIRNFEKKKQNKTNCCGHRCFITFPTLFNKILQELNLSGLFMPILQFT